MKKGLAITLSATLCLSPLGTLLPVLAVSQTEEKSAAQNFLEKYAGVMKTSTNGKQTGTVFAWFKAADASNAAILIEGNAVFQKLSDADQKAVLAAYKEQKINYDKLLMDARVILNELAAQKAKEAEAAKQAEEAKVQEAEKQADEQKAQETAKPAEVKAEATDSSAQENEEVKAPAKPASLTTGDENVPEAEADASKPEAKDAVLEDQLSSKETAQSEEAENQPSENKDETDVQPIAEDNQDNKTVLYTGSLKTVDGKTALQITGEPASLTKGEADAIYAWMQQEKIQTYEVFSRVVYTAAAGDKKAVSAPMYAIKTPDALRLFSIEYNADKQQYELTEYSIKSISFDFVTETLAPSTINTFNYAYIQEPAAPENPDDANQPSDKPETPDDSKPSDKPGTPDDSKPSDKPESPDDSKPSDKPETPDDSKPSDSDKPETPAQTQKPGTTQTQKPAAPSKEEEEAAKALAAQNKAQAATFIKTYCTNSAGQVYASANAYNYRQILNGYNSWKKLSQAVRKEINAQMSGYTGKTFATLFSEANRIRLGQVQGGGAAAKLPTAAKNPQTAARSMASGYIFGMMMSSLGFFVSLLRKKDII